MAGTQTGMLVTPGGRTRGENRSTCIAIVLRRVRYANRYARFHMVALGHGEHVNRHARLPSGRAGT